MVQLAYRSLLEMNHAIHTGTLCIFSCGTHNFFINIISLDIHLNIGIHHFLGFIYCIVPELTRYQVCPLLC